MIELVPDRGQVEFAASASSSVEGFLSIEALFQSGQPSLILDLDAKLQLKSLRRQSVRGPLIGTLSGTEPWHVKGKATLRSDFDYSVSVDHTLRLLEHEPPGRCQRG
jgi:hypothetical protein